MNSELTFGPGRMAVVHLRIVLEDGTVAEDTHNGEPLCLVHGDGTLLDRLERRIEGLATGDHRDWELSPDEAFGQRDHANVRSLPRERFPDDVEPRPGNVIAFALPDGNELPGTVIGASDDGSIVIDFNHPLAGRTLRFEVEVVSVAAAS